MMPSPELQSKISAMRIRAAQGTLSKEEMKEAILMIRKDRKSAAIASETSASTKVSKAKAIVPTAEEMLKELGF